MSSNYFDQFDEPENGAAPADRAFEAPTERDPQLQQYANIFEAGIKREKNKAIYEAFGREVEAHPFFQLDDPSTVVSASLVGGPKQGLATDAVLPQVRRGVGVGFEMFGQGIEQYTGDNAASRGFQSFGQRQQSDAPDRAVPSIYDVKSVPDFVKWLWESAQEGVGTSAPAIVGGLAASPLGPIGVTVGVGVMSNVMGVGQMRNALEDERAEYFNRAERAKQAGNTILEQYWTEEGAKLDPEKNRAIVQVAGTIIGLLDTITPVATMLGIAPQHVVNELKSKAFRYVVAHIAKRAAQGAATEGTTEAAQAVVEIAAVLRAKGVTSATEQFNNLWENRWRVLDEAAAGAAGGTAFGVIGSAGEVAGAGRGASEPPTGAENFFDRFDTPEERAAAQAPQQPAETPQAPAAPTPAPTQQQAPAATPAPAITPAEVVSQPPVGSVTPDFDPNVYADDILTSGTIPEGARPAEIEAALPVMDERIAEVQSRLDAAKEEVAAVEGEADTSKVDALTEQLERVKMLKAEAEAARDAAVEAAEQAKQQLIDSQPTPEMQKLVEYITGGGLLGTAEMPAIAKAAGVEPEALPALMEEAVTRGVLRKNKRGQYRRAVPGSAQSQASPEQRVASVRQTVQDVARAMAPMLPRGTTVRSFAALADLPANLQGQMTEQGGTVRDAVTGNEIDAFVDPNDPRVIYLAEYALRKEGRVGHEAVHILKKLNLLNDAEIKTLAERARKTGKFGKDIEQQYRQAYAGRADLDSLINEEAAAALIEARINGESFGKKINTILDRVIQFLERLANALRQRGFQTADDIADAVLSGEVARREAVQQFMAENDITAMAVRPAAVEPTPQPSGPRLSRVTTPDGSASYDVEFEVVNLSDLKPATGDLQPRDRSSRAASAAQVQSMAGNLNPDLLIYSAQSDRGAPIIDENGVVLSGNGRVSAIRAAREMGADGYQQYVARLNAEGFDTAGKDQPVLVRRIKGLDDAGKREFAVKSNQDDKLAMSAGEQARVDRDLMTDDTLALLDPDGDGGLRSPGNRAFVRAVMGKMSAAQRGAFVGEGGELSPAGVARLEAAIFARAYDDRTLVNRIVEDQDGAGMRNALLGAAPAWAQMRAVAPDGFDVTQNLTEAVSTVIRLRERRIKPNEYFAQQDAFSQVSPITETLIRSFYNRNGTRAASWQSTRDLLKSYARIAMDQGNAVGDLMGQTLTPRDIIEGQLRTRSEDQSLLFAMRAVESGATRVENIGPSDPHPGRVLAYHATGADFENFDIDQWGNFASNDLGLHFGTTGQAAEVARRFGIDPKTIEEVGGWDEAVRVEPNLQTWRPRSYPVVLNLRNPITLDPKIGSVRTASAETIVFNLEQMVDRGDDVTFTRAEVDALDKAVREANARGGGLSAMPLVRQFLNDHGYDGARYRNTIDGDGWSYITWNRNTVESQTSGDLLYAMRPGDNSIQRDNPMRSVQVIVQDLAQSLGLTVRQGMRTANARAARRQGAQGIYDAATGVIRLRSIQDLNAAIQGIGLAIEHQYDAPNPQGPLGTLIALNQAELVDGFGVWFQQYLTAPAQAQANAPNFTQYFETFLDVNDPVLLAKLESAQDAIALYYQQQPAQWVESMVRDARVPGFWEGVREDVRRFGLRGTLSLRLNTFYTQAFDDTNPFAVAVWETLREFRRQTGQGLDIATNENPAKIMRLAKHSPAHAMRAMEEGIRPRNSTRPRGPSLIQAMVTALGDNITNARDIGPGSRYRQFGAYLIARYSALEWERFRNGQKEAQPTRYPAGTFTPTQAIQFYQGVAAGLEQQYGSFRQAADMLYDYQRELLALQRDAGLISTETYDTLIQDREYVPMYRVFEDSEDLASSRALGGGPGGILKRKRGSERDIVDPLASIAQKTYETYDLVARNDIKRSLLVLAERVGPAGGVIAERIDPNRLRATNIDLDTAITNAAREAGVDSADRAALIDLMHQMLGNDAVSTYYTQNTITPGREPIVFFFENGQVQAMRLGNGGHGHQLARQMFDALNTYGRQHLDVAIQLAAIPAQMTRLGVVTHPEFMAANPVRDALMAFMYDPQAIPLWTQIRGTVDVIRNADYVRQYYAYGGMMGGEATSALNRLRTERDVQALVDQGYRFRYFDSLPSSMRFLMDTVSSAAAGAVMVGGTVIGGATGASFGGLLGFAAGSVAGGTAARVALGRLGIGRNALDRGVGGAIGAIAGGALAGPVGAGVGFTAGTLIGGKALAAAGEVSETATRARLWQLAYNRARANGVDEVSAAQEAAFWAHDYTDYSRRGSKMDALAAMIPFLNANLQGNDVYIRRLLGKTDQSYVSWSGPLAYPAYRLGLLDATNLTPQENQALALSGWAWAMTIIGLGSISALVAMTWDDDERIKNIDDRVKSTHWLLPIGDTIVRIPKPFQTVWFSQLIERYVAQLKHNDPRWFEAYLEDMWNTWKPPVVPSIAETVATSAGYDLNTGRQIIPFYMQMGGVRSRPEQYDAYTSDFARWMGRELDTAPMYVDHLVHKFGATWGRTLTDLNVPGLPWFNPNKPTKGPEEEFIARRFLWKVGRGSEAGQAIREIMGAEEPIRSIWSRIAQPYSKLAVAGQDYRRYLEKVVPDHAGSVEHLESLSPAERGYAVLEGHFRGRTDAKFRMLHPMNRAEKITGEIIKLQKEILSDQLASGKKGKDAKPIPLSPSEKAAARDILTQLQMMEAHNALVISREVGWENRILFDTGAVMKEFREAVPSLAKEYDARMQKAGVLPFAGIRRVWPELKARLESDDVMDMARKNQLGRLRGMIAGAYSRAQFAMPDVQQTPETVSQ